MRGRAKSVISPCMVLPHTLYGFNAAPDRKIERKAASTHLCTSMKDFLTDQDGNLLIEDGDFVIGDPTEQNIQAILESHKGEWREFPEVGAAMAEYLNDEDRDEMLIEAKRQLEYDGLIVEELKITADDKMIVVAKYPEDGR